MNRQINLLINGKGGLRSFSYRKRTIIPHKQSIGAQAYNDSGNARQQLQIQLACKALEHSCELQS
jgi:hypothetical protein